MRPKQWQCVITFFNTTGAMEFEKVAKGSGFTGRLIPVPREITAGCGLAWRENLEQKEPLLKLLDIKKVNYSGIFELYI